MGKGGGGTNTVVQNSAPPADVTAQYNQVIAQANQTAATPYTAGGFNASNMIAGFSPDQLSAFNTVDQSQGIQQPYLAAGQADLNASQTPLWNGVQQYSPSTMAQYANPYLNQAVGATEAQIQNTNAQQQNQVMGNAISSGAWGGDRSAIAQSELANQQALAENQTISGMENTGFNQQQGEFNTQQASQLGANEANAWLGSQGAALESGLGTTAQSTALNGATAQYNMGLNQQQQQQSELNVPYEQFQAQQAYPFQTGSWLSNISEGIGGSEGGVGTTTSPAPNALSQDIGTAAGAGTLGYLGYMANQALPAGYGAVAGASSLGIKRGGAVHRASGGFTPQNFDNGGGAGGATPGYLPLSAFESSAPPSVGTVNVGTPNMGRGSMGPPAIKNSTGSNSTTTGGQPQGGGVNGLTSAMQLGKFALSGGYAGAEPSAASMLSGASGEIGSGIDVTGGATGGFGPNAFGSFGSGAAAPVGGFGSGVDLSGSGAIGSGAGISGDFASGLNAGADLSTAASATGVTDAGAALTDAAASSGFLSGIGDAISSALPFAAMFNKGGSIPGRAPGGFVPKHYDGGGGIGLPTAQQTGASPGAANVANQFQNMTVEQLQQLNARSGGRNPQIQMALQRKQMTGGAAQQPQQAGIAPMAAQAQGAAPPAQAAAVPSGAQPENIMQQNGFARGGFTPQKLATEGTVNDVYPEDAGGSPDQYSKDLANLNSTLGPQAGISPAANTNMPPPANDNQGFMPQQATGTTGMAPLPSHDDFMKNYNATVMNAAPYNKPDPILALLGTMAHIGAGRSSKFGVNAGQGAAEGIQDWANQNKEAASESERRGTLQEQGENMYQNMVEARAKMSQEQAKIDQDAPLKAAQANYYNSGAGAGNHPVAVMIDGKPQLVPAKEAMQNGYSPMQGFSATQATLSPGSIKQLSDAVYNGVPASSLGLGMGMNGDKKAVLNQLAIDHPDADIAGARISFAGNTSGARTVSNMTGKIEYASDSLASMIPLAKQASANLDRTQYPSVNAIQNAVEKGTGGNDIVALNTYLNAVIADQSSLFVRGGLSTDAARAKATENANAALSDGQLNTYFDSVQKEIAAQGTAGKAALSHFTSQGKDGQGAQPAPAPSSAAIEHLKSNPSLAPQFEQKYGIKADQYLQ